MEAGEADIYTPDINKDSWGSFSSHRVQAQIFMPPTAT